MNIYGNAVGHPLADPRNGMEMTGPINMNGQSIKGLNAPTADDEAVNLGFVKNLGKAKAGFIYPLASAVVPDGFLLCDGAAYARSEYPELFAAIGTMYGSGDGSTTFNVPDLRGRVPAGAGDNHPAGEMVGEEAHQLTKEELPSDMGTNGQAFMLSNMAAAVIETPTATGASNQSGLLFPDSVFKDQPHNNMQPTTYIRGYIIATGKGTGVSVADIIMGAQALPLGLEYGGVGATDPKTARENLEITPENIGALSMELLWENASPESAFAEQDVVVPVGKDGTILIEADIGSGMGSSGKTIVLGYPSYTGNICRIVEVYDSYVHFHSGKAYMFSYGEDTNNSFAIPLRIYRVKGVSA